MKREAIEYFDRGRGELRREAVYGEGFLRWAYGTAGGRLGVWALARRRLFSWWYGWRMGRPSSRRRVRPFVGTYGLDVDEFRKGVDEYESFNDFFYRELGEGARPVAAGGDVVVFPADGRHLAVPELGRETCFFVKGQRFDVGKLLGDAGRGARYEGGSLVLSRLCPVDYHRFHFPVAGHAGVPSGIDGWLYSVNPMALRRRLAYLWENKRVVTEIVTDGFGMVTMVEVGATCVGTIVQTAAMPGPVEKGAEKGFFSFGGSAVVTLFERGAVELAGDLREWSTKGIEVYAKVGEPMGRGGGVGSG